MYSRRSNTYQLSKQCVEDSERWFGDTIDSQDPIEGLVHHGLSLAGESGEACNIIKKIQRGSLNLGDKAVRDHLAEELTDVYIYLLNLAGILGCDLEEVYNYKRAKNEERFILERTLREA